MAQRICAAVVADIGSDHGYLPAYLLQTGRAQRVIVVEKTLAPYERARLALRRVAAEVRLGDGLDPLQPGEVDCLTMSGFGARQMVQILSRHPERVPASVVLQPNGEVQTLLEWALANGYELQGRERCDEGRIYEIVHLCNYKKKCPP